jgi:hypothetical protein
MGHLWDLLAFCWPCISVYLSQYLTNLMHKICFTITFISCRYMFWAHVLIIRRSNLHYTASGIITPIGGRLVLLTVHLSIFISVFNQLDAQNLLHNKFYFVPLHVSSTCAHHQEVKIALYSVWYHHTYRCDDTRGCVIQFWPDDEHMCSKHVEAWNKSYCKTNFEYQVG